MSYRCDSCNEVRYGSELKIVTAARNVKYSHYFSKFDKVEKKTRYIFDKSFTGWEIINEGRFCPSCYEELKDKPPEIQDTKDVKFLIKKNQKRGKINAIHQEGKENSARSYNRHNDQRKHQD